MTDLGRAILTVAQHCMNYPMREVRISWLEVQAELRRLQEAEERKAS